VPFGAPPSPPAQLPFAAAGSRTAYTTPAPAGAAAHGFTAPPADPEPANDRKHRPSGSAPRAIRTLAPRSRSRRRPSASAAAAPPARSAAPPVPQASTRGYLVGATHRRRARARRHCARIRTVAEASAAPDGEELVTGVAARSAPGWSGLGAAIAGGRAARAGSTGRCRLIASPTLRRRRASRRMRHWPPRWCHHQRRSRTGRCVDAWIADHSARGARAARRRVCAASALLGAAAFGSIAPAPASAGTATVATQYRVFSRGQWTGCSGTVSGVHLRRSLRAGWIFGSGSHDVRARRVGWSVQPAPAHQGERAADAAVCGPPVFVVVPVLGRHEPPAPQLETATRCAVVLQTTTGGCGTTNPTAGAVTPRSARTAAERSTRRPTTRASGGRHAPTAEDPTGAEACDGGARRHDSEGIQSTGHGLKTRYWWHGGRNRGSGCRGDRSERSGAEQRVTAAQTRRRAGGRHGRCVSAIHASTAPAGGGSGAWWWHQRARPMAHAARRPPAAQRRLAIRRHARLEPARAARPQQSPPPSRSTWARAPHRPSPTPRRSGAADASATSDPWQGRLARARRRCGGGLYK